MLHKVSRLWCGLQLICHRHLRQPLGELTTPMKTLNINSAVTTLGLPANIVCCSRAMTKIITISMTHGQTLVQDNQKAL